MNAMAPMNSALSSPSVYDMAVDHVRGVQSIRASELSKALGIVSAVAKGFLDKMVDARIIAPANDVGRHLVLNAASTHDAPSFSSDDVITGAAQGRLRTIVERIERLEEDKAVIANDIKEVYGEAKGEGFDVKILRKVVRIRKQDVSQRSEEEALVDLYLSAIEG